jgi:hypothetical protein
MSQTASADPFNRVGTTDPNYLGVTLPRLNSYLAKGAQFNAFNAGSRLSGFLVNTLTNVHTKFEVPEVRLRLQSSVSKATLDSYIDHLKADGDGLLAAIGSMRTATDGGDRAAYSEEISRSTARYNLLANSANFNYGFLQTSARQHFYSAAYHNQQTDFWHGCSKFFWFRAEKHFQVQSATASRYVTEAAEDFYKDQYEQSVTRRTQIKTWQVVDTEENPGSFKIDLRKEIYLKAQDLYIKALEDLLLEVTNLYIQSSDTIRIASEQQVYISGSQIFLGSQSLGTKEFPLEQPVATAPPPNITTLPAYIRTQLMPNGGQPVVAHGVNLTTHPPI